MYLLDDGEYAILLQAKVTAHLNCYINLENEGGWK